MPNFTIQGVSHRPVFQEMDKMLHFMAQTWYSHGYLIWFFLNLNQCGQGCSMKISHSWMYPVTPFPRNGQNMALYGQNMLLTWSLKLVFLNPNQCAQGCSLPNIPLLDVSCSPHSYKWPKYGPLWPKHGLSNWFFLNLNHCAQ